MLQCVAPVNPAMSIGGFVKARLRMARLHRARAYLVALACTSRSPVASHNSDMGDDDSVVDDLDVSSLDPSVPMATPTLERTAALATDTLNTHGWP